MTRPEWADAVAEIVAAAPEPTPAQVALVARSGLLFGGDRDA